MATRKFRLVGRPLDDAALKAFPEQSKVPFESRDERQELTTADFNDAELIEDVARLSYLTIHSIALQCPVGPHDDPGLETAVARCCSVSKSRSVAVQCTQGHWAEYPCG